MSAKHFIMAVSAAILFAVVLFGCGGGGSGAGKLVTEVSPRDGGTVSRDINQAVYPAGTNVTLTAEPAQGYIFKEWRGAVSGNTRTISVATVGNMKVTAVFERLSESGSQLTDSRDGKRYRTIRIGSQTWMAENLNYQTGNSWCYDNDESNCNIYGRLYDWNTAMSACPAGWHLPTDEEWDVLMTAVGGSNTAGRKLKSTSGWSENGNGTDDFGFSALPGGGRWGSSFDVVGSWGGWWSATEFGAVGARYRLMYYDLGSVGSRWYFKRDGLSVRCVRD